MSKLLQRSVSAVFRVHPCTAAALVAGASLASASSAAVVVNGNFEAGSFSGWTVSGDVSIAQSPIIGFNDPGYGSYIAVFNGGDQAPNGVLSQTISTVAGQLYALTFDYGVNSSGGQSITAAVLDGTGGQSQLASQFVSSSSTALQLNTITFTALSTLTTLKFSDYAGNNTVSKDGALDNVSVTAVPEPASWAMMIGGFGMMGATMRRSRKVAVHFA